MVYRGHVHGGVVVLPPEVLLPDGTRVTVEVEQSVPELGTFSDLPLRNGVPVFQWSHPEGEMDLDRVNQLRDEQP